MAEPGKTAAESKDRPTGDTPEAHHSTHTPDGLPHEEPRGLPSNDRHDTETAAGGRPKKSFRPTE